MIDVAQTGALFLKGNVLSLSDGYLTFAPYIYNIPLKSPYVFDVRKRKQLSGKPMESSGLICSKAVSNSNTLLESLTKSGKLTSIKTPSIADYYLKLCLNDIIEVQNTQQKPFATSRLVEPGRFCIETHLALLAATGLINYKGEFDCWRGIIEPLGFEEFTNPPPLVNADAPLMAYILDHTRDEIFVELNGIPRRALLSSIYGLPIFLVNIAPKKFKLIGGVTPRGVKLSPREKIIQIERPLEFQPSPKKFWSTGEIVC
ncbi:hypothetical protein GcM1_217062 [Golovinomyces cichoracearum]|uniref:Uncharacterized protein n=1 Tax=Golovinomyces cichoracearum TaxID=62708 RepID=A0A420IT76_9PEZI|nr:hypothetical protein GcM1_217062 [Golovinomyces cichoracearum]